MVSSAIFLNNLGQTVDDDRSVKRKYRKTFEFVMNATPPYLEPLLSTLKHRTVDTRSRKKDNDCHDTEITGFEFLLSSEQQRAYFRLLLFLVLLYFI